METTSKNKHPDISHGYPAELSEAAEKAKNNLINSRKKPRRIDAEHDKFYCKNWGCGQIFVQSANTGKCCKFHPGVWQFASYNGNWPECWSCCEGEWDSPGCVEGIHRGVLQEERVMLCLNHGEVNPVTKHPDSACGKYFTEAEKDGCSFHPGYVKKGVFTCCGGDKESSGCQKGDHASAEYPDEKAKLYFFPKPLLNPGVINSTGNKPKGITVGKLICKCDYFKPIDIPYVNAKKEEEEKRAKKERELTEPRYCMHWGCEKVYTEKEYENGIVRNCCCHPGKWDHGCTGTKTEQYAAEIDSNERKVILWKPHWTCCHGEWNSKGCTMTRHRGPLISALGPDYKRYPWPSERLKLSFSKVISDRWRNVLEKNTFSEKKVKSIVNKYWEEYRRVTNGDLPKLCDKLKLDVLVINDNVDYVMKFQDIVTYSRSVKFFSTGEGRSSEVDKDKFVKWWFMPYEKFFDVIDPDEKPIVVASLVQKKK